MSAPDPPRAALRARLLADGLLWASGEAGLYARSARFEQVVRAVDALVSRRTPPGTEQWSFPPLQPRADFERTGYLASFPNLAGSVHVFTGGDREHAALLAAAAEDGDWSAALRPAASVLCSAVCQPLYPMCRGPLPPGGRLIEVTGWVFRHEPSLDPCRMQLFRQHDHVYLGGADEVATHLAGWLERGTQLLAEIGLDVEQELASDAFFGRAGRILADSMRDTQLKHELVTAVDSATPDVALMSANNHLEHFSSAFGITQTGGAPAHSGCIGFGLDRVAVALFARHGSELTRWPAEVLRTLRLEAGDAPAPRTG